MSSLFNNSTQVARGATNLINLATDAMTTATNGYIGGYRHNLYKIDLQNPNLWEFNFDDISVLGIKFNIYSINVPFKKLEHETHTTGYKYFKNYSPEGEISISFRETTSFKVLTFLKEWQNEIFDEEERVFNSGNHSKHGTLTFNTHTFIQKQISQNISFPLSDVLINNLEKNTLRINFENMRIASIEDYSLDYEGTSHLSTNATFICDNVETEMSLPFISKIKLLPV